MDTVIKEGNVLKGTGDGSVGQGAEFIVHWMKLKTWKKKGK